MKNFCYLGHTYCTVVATFQMSSSGCYTGNRGKHSPLVLDQISF